MGRQAAPVLGSRATAEGGQFLDAAVTGEPAGVAHELSQPWMIGVLVLHQARREDNARPNPPDDTCQFDGVGQANFKVRITVGFRTSGGGGR